MSATEWIGFLTIWDQDLNTRYRWNRKF